MHVLPIFYIKKLFFNGANLVSGSKSLWPDWEHVVVIRRVWIYQRGNQNPYIEEEQTTQWPKEKVHKDKQRSTKHTYKTKDRVTRTPLKTGGELRCYGRVSNSCSTSGTRRVNLVTNPVLNREWGKDREVFTTSGTHPWSFVTQIFHSGQPSQVKFSKWWLQLYQKELLVQ
jgi:hypothetical protein